jgi:hypothetical protein
LRCRKVANDADTVPRFRAPSDKFLAKIERPLFKWSPHLDAGMKWVKVPAGTAETRRHPWQRDILLARGPLQRSYRISAIPLRLIDQEGVDTGTSVPRETPLL